MTVRWSPEAAADFAAIVEYIRKQNPSAAERVAHKIYEGVAALAVRWLVTLATMFEAK